MWSLLWQLCHICAGNTQNLPWDTLGRAQPENGTLPYSFCSSDLLGSGSLGQVNFKMEEETAKNIQIQIVRERLSKVVQELGFIMHQLPYVIYTTQKLGRCKKTPHVLLSLKADFFFPTKHLPSA